MLKESYKAIMHLPYIEQLITNLVQTTFQGNSNLLSIFILGLQSNIILLVSVAKISIGSCTNLTSKVLAASVKKPEFTICASP